MTDVLSTGHVDVRRTGEHRKPASKFALVLPATKSVRRRAAVDAARAFGLDVSAEENAARLRERFKR